MVNKWIKNSIIIILLISIVLNIYQYNTINKYRSTFQSIDSTYTEQFDSLSHLMKNFEGTPGEIKYLTAILYGTQLLQYYAMRDDRNNTSYSIVYTATIAMYNAFIGEKPDDIKLIKDNKLELSKQFETLSKDPNNIEAQRRICDILGVDYPE